LSTRVIHEEDEKASIQRKASQQAKGRAKYGQENPKQKLKCLRPNKLIANTPLMTNGDQHSETVKQKPELN